MHSRNLSQIIRVAEGLGSQASHIVFTGAGTLELYLDDPAAPEVHPASSVSGIFRGQTLLEFYAFTRELGSLGFVRLDPADSLPVNWAYGQVPVRLYPSHPEPAGFRNRWFEEGVFHARSCQLSEQLRIRILTSPYFMAAKMEAFQQRGGGHFRSSPDFEDIVFLLAYCTRIRQEIEASFYSVRDYIRSQMQRYLQHPALVEGIYQVLPFDASEWELRKVLEVMQQVAGSRQAMAL